MSKANPTKAIHALLPEAIHCSGGVQVLPLTLAHYAILESVDSPFLWEAERCKTEPVDGINMLASLYIVTHDAKAVHRDLDVLEELAVSWANELPVSIAQELKAAVHRQFDSLTEVLPETADGKKKVVTMAGLFRWLTRPLRFLAGLGIRFFTRRQQLL